MFRRPCIVTAASFLSTIVAGTAMGAEKANEQVSPFSGSFSYALPIEVPPFHGLEPKLALKQWRAAATGTAKEA